MTNCDMHTINAYADSSFDLLDQYSIRRRAPPNDDNYGGTNDLKEISKLDEGNMIRVNYTRLFNTGDPYDAILGPVINICELK